ncbi:phosphotransferase family protein [Streptomyces sp. NPDC020983]|uniref:phosphotransferase family protein n=1 Tax=Streptomyces sp. NPDC020983 TaxID=3365106 RepID=UPI0037ACA19D
MTSGRWSTHGIEIAADRVTKRFLPGSRERAAREWRALTLLSAHAPGLAPEPLAAELAAERPVVVMSRLPGTPLRDAAPAAEQLDALAAALTALHSAVPPAVLDTVPPRAGRPSALRPYLDRWAAEVRPRAAGTVRRAMEAGVGWLARSGPDDAERAGVPAVLGPGDGNLANYLWDGSRVRAVDFEESGRSDRAFELAEITEHVGAWAGRPLDVPGLLARLDLTRAEAARLRACRRLLALVWLFLLAQDDPANPRNPPGTAVRQAVRVLELLG